MNKGRFTGHYDPKVKSLNPTPKRSKDEQKEIWDEFNSDFPWLGSSDRALIEVAVNLTDLMRTSGPAAPVAVYAHMRMDLGKMGGIPADRRKVYAPKDAEKDPVDDFLNSRSGRCLRQIGRARRTCCWAT